MQCYKSKEQCPFLHGGENDEFCPRQTFQRSHIGLERRVEFKCLWNGREEHITVKRMNQDTEIWDSICGDK